MFRTVSRRMAFLLISLVMSFAVPLGIALASHQFSDVPDSNPFHGDITAVANAGVTSGCGGGKFCPDRNVTRAEMAAFMNRLGALASNKTPVVNATTVDRWNANELNRLAYTNHDGENYTSPLVDGASTSAGRLTTTITTPSRGYLMINGVGNLYNETISGEDAINCWLEVNNNEVPGSNAWVDTQFVSGTTNNDQTTCSPMGGYTVCSAATYTVDLEFGSVGALGNVYDAALTVEYIPFNGAGNLPSILFECPIIIFPHDAAVPEKAAE